uniref:Uncharacterized protein n=1 Tax=Vespula pensylvanica TaxID=30213 RepID=A0A834UGJ5_VESPE|nr:hypothetical protein H0235_000619 [Vespula pensylvanica]
MAISFAHKSHEERRIQTGECGNERRKVEGREYSKGECAARNEEEEKEEEEDDDDDEEEEEGEEEEEEEEKGEESSGCIIVGHQRRVTRILNKGRLVQRTKKLVDAERVDFSSKS